MPINVVITDDHLMVIDGLKNAIHNYPNIHLMGVHTRGNTLLKSLEQARPDVLILDLQLPDTTGHELVSVIAKKYPEIRILILSGMDSSSNAKYMIQQGCTGYLLKTNTDQQTLIHAIETVYTGEVFVDPSLKEEMFTNMLKVKRQNNNSLQLTLREKEILQLIIEEYSNQEIAEKLFLSLRTVENHKYHLLQKLNVKNTVGLVKVALQMGLVE